MLIQICPSFGKTCGIAKYTEYVSYFLKRHGYNVTILKTAKSLTGLCDTSLYKIEAIFVQYEGGLFNLNSKLGAGETTKGMIKTLRRLSKQYEIPVYIVMHAIRYDRKKWDGTRKIIDSGFDVISLNPLAAEIFNIKFMDHGIPNFIESSINMHEMPRDRSPHLFHFGLLSGIKNVDILFQLAEYLNLPLDSNFASNNKNNVREVQKKVSKSTIEHKVTYDFMSEQSLISRWRGQYGVFVNPQNDLNGYYSSSRSTRFAYNFQVPIVCSGYIQHLGLDSVICVPKSELLAGVLKALTNFDELSHKVDKEKNEKTIAKSYIGILKSD